MVHVLAWRITGPPASNKSAFFPSHLTLRLRVTVLQMLTAQHLWSRMDLTAGASGKADPIREKPKMMRIRRRSTLMERMGGLWKWWEFRIDASNQSIRRAIQAKTAFACKGVVLIQGQFHDHQSNSSATICWWFSFLHRQSYCFMGVFIDFLMQPAQQCAAAKLWAGFNTCLGSLRSLIWCPGNWGKCLSHHPASLAAQKGAHYGCWVSLLATEAMYRSMVAYGTPEPHCCFWQCGSGSMVLFSFCENDLSF